MTIAVDLGRKATKQTNKQKEMSDKVFKNKLSFCIGIMHVRMNASDHKTVRI